MPFFFWGGGGVAFGFATDYKTFDVEMQVGGMVQHRGKRSVWEENCRAPFTRNIGAGGRHSIAAGFIILVLQ